MTKTEVEELRNLDLELEGLKARKQAIKDRLVNHRDSITDKEAVEKMDKEFDEVEADIKKKEDEIRSAKIKIEQNKNQEGEKRFMENLENSKNASKNDEVETRAMKFKESGRMTISNKEMRSTLVSSGTIATPTGVSAINDAFNKVSSIVDQVKVVDCEGMGANKIPYVKEIAEADVTVEGELYHKGDTIFGYKEITPSTVSVLTSISKQVQKQSPVVYEAKVRESALAGLRKKVGNIIVTKVLASDLNVTLNGITAIDEKTLRKIALNYGGDENVVGNAVLYLNKKDLIKFGDVRGTANKNAVYDITPDTANPNTGIIKDGGLSVPYCINSSLAEGTMFYGQPQKCELDLFSNYEIKISDDFYFDKGLLAIRGDVELGADVVCAEGFVKLVISPGKSA